MEKDKILIKGWILKAGDQILEGFLLKLSRMHVQWTSLI